MKLVEKYSVLCHWNDRWHGDWHEVIDRLVMTDAEALAKECRRLGAVVASVCSTGQARHLAANFNGKHRPATAIA